jgi:hypothetical protein
MKNLVRNTILVMIIIAGFSSCGFPYDAVFFAEQYWWDLLSRDPAVNRDLERICNEHGYNFKLTLAKPDEDYAEQLKLAAAGPRVKLIITGPLMASEVDTLAPEQGEKQFVVLGASEYFKFTAPNVISVNYNRTEAYIRAGEILSTLLGPDYYYMFENLQEKKVGIIFSSETDKAREQVEGFEQGFLEKQPEARVVTHAMENPGDRVEAIREVENLYSQDVRIFLLKIYALVPACIQKITALNAYYIIEEWKYLDEYKDHLLFSIDDDINTALASALEVMPVPEQSSWRAVNKHISVPCRITWGGAVPLPKELKSKVDGAQAENN